MRKHFDEPVVAYMTRDFTAVHVDTSVEEVARELHGRDISGLPVLDDKGLVVGVVTRTDLIQLGLNSRRRASRAVMSLPHGRASDVMTHGAEQISSTTSLRHAARVMVDNLIHRVFVTEGGRLAGVICAVDLAAAVRDARLQARVETVMTSPIVTIDIEQPLGAALDLLERAHVTGLIVTEEARPIGMFTQTDALASRDLPPSTPIEETYDASVICLPSDMKLHRVAAHVADLRVRRVVLYKGSDAVGVVSALDFARVVALA